MVFFFFVYSDTMGNKGAFITMKGKDMKPNFTTYEAVVSGVFNFAFVVVTSNFSAASQRETNGIREFIIKFDVLVLAHQPVAVQLGQFHIISVVINFLFFYRERSTLMIMYIIFKLTVAILILPI